MKFPITVTYRNLEAKIYRSQIDGVKYYKARLGMSSVRDFVPSDP